MTTPMVTTQLVDGAGAPVGTATNPLQATGGGGGSGVTQAAPSYSYVVSDTSGTQPIGAPADASATSDTGSFSLLALVKRGLTNWTTLLGRIPALVSGRVPVDGSAVTQPVSGTFWQATQPVSAASLPLPAGAATSARQPSFGTAGSPSIDVLTIQGAAAGTALPVSPPKLSAGPTTARIAVATGATATAILAAGRSDEMVSLKNSGTVKAYIGGTSVTVTNGWPLAVGESMTMDAKMAEGGISAILDTAQSTAGEIAVWRF